MGAARGPLAGGRKKVLAELMDQDAEAPRGITEAAGGLITGQPLDEVGAEGFVLTMGGVGRLEEDAGEVS